MYRSYLNELSISPLSWKEWTYNNIKVSCTHYGHSYTCKLIKLLTEYSHPKELYRLWSIFVSGMWTNYSYSVLNIGHL